MSLRTLFVLFLIVIDSVFSLSFGHYKYRLKKNQECWVQKSKSLLTRQSVGEMAVNDISAYVTEEQTDCVWHCEMYIH